MFINLGAMDGFDPGKLLRFLCDASNQKSSVFGRMDIKDTYTFIDVDASVMAKVVASLHGEVYRGRRIRADIDGGRGPSHRGGAPERGGRYEGQRPRQRFTSERLGGRGNDRSGSRSYGKRHD